MSDLSSTVDDMRLQLAAVIGSMRDERSQNLGLLHSLVGQLDRPDNDFIYWLVQEIVVRHFVVVLAYFLIAAVFL